MFLKHGFYRTFIIQNLPTTVIFNVRRYYTSKLENIYELFLNNLYDIVVRTVRWQTKSLIEVYRYRILMHDVTLTMHQRFFSSFLQQIIFSVTNSFFFLALVFVTFSDNFLGIRLARMQNIIAKRNEIEFELVSYFLLFNIYSEFVCDTNYRTIILSNMCTPHL